MEPDPTMRTRDSGAPEADPRLLFGPDYDAAKDSATTEVGAEPHEGSPQGTDPTESPDLSKVREMTVSLARTAKAVRFYPPENSICRQLLSELVTHIHETLRRSDTVRLSIGCTKIFFTGEVVLEQPGRDESLPGHLYWNGVREVCFHVGITQEEVRDLVLLLRQSMEKKGAREDDLVTLLWDRKFDHITYLAVDDLLDLENDKDPLPEEFGREFINFIDLELHELETDGETERRVKEMTETIRSRLHDEDVQLFRITDEDREALLAELRQEESPQAVQDGAVRILVETLFAEHEEASFVNLTSILGRTLLGRICEGRLGAAAGLVEVFRELREGRDQLTPTMRTAIDAALSATWNPTQCEILTFHLDSGDTHALNSLDGFLQALPEEAIGPLCEILGSLESARARRRMIDALVRRARNNCKPFLPILEDHRWYLVRNIALILGSIGNDEAIPPLTKVLRHQDPRVRREALHAVNEIAPERSLASVARTFTDPDGRVRMTAARNAAMAGRKAVPHLLDVINAKDFPKRTLDERRTFFEALGYAGGRTVIAFLRDIVNRRSLLHRAQLDELRSCACHALGWTEADEAVDLLTLHLEDRSSLVQSAARAGLALISAGGDREPFIEEAA